MIGLNSMAIFDQGSADMRHVRLILAGFALAVISAVGCASQPAASQYETVENIPNRDSKKASEYNHTALTLLEEGRYDEAEAQLKKALTADVTYGIAHNNLGKVYYHQSKYYLAAWEFQYAIKLIPHHPEPRNNLGLVMEAVGRLDEAVDMYGQALNIQPDNPQILGNLARARIRRGDRDDDTRKLLSDLIMRDTRPEWVSWAREKLPLMSNSEDKSPR